MPREDPKVCPFKQRYVIEDFHDSIHDIEVNTDCVKEDCPMWIQDSTATREGFLADRYTRLQKMCSFRAIPEILMLMIK